MIHCTAEAWVVLALAAVRWSVPTPRDLIRSMTGPLYNAINIAPVIEIRVPMTLARLCILLTSTLSNLIIKSKKLLITYYVGKLGAFVDTNHLESTSVGVQSNKLSNIKNMIQSNPVEIVIQFGSNLEISNLEISN